MAFLLKESCKVKFLTSDILSCRHGFSTRIGGVSTAEHTASMNLAFGRGDDDEIVIKNLELFSRAVGISPETIVSREQVHSSNVVYVDEGDCGDGYYRRSGQVCDGYVTDRPGVTLGIKTADCVPILFQDERAGVIGAVHAGWRGTVSGIAKECVAKLLLLGASPEGIRAAIGPAIHSCCYTVGEDFYRAVEASLGERAAREYVKYIEDIKNEDGQSCPSFKADIVGMNIMLLRESGVDQIDVSELCTCEHTELFHSHRATKGKRGTMLSVIAL